LTRIGLRGDEVVYAGQALILVGDQEMTRFFVLASRGVTNFLFHQELQALTYFLLGVSDFTTRLLPVIFSVITIVVIYFLGRELFDKWSGTVAAFLLAINGYAISLGRLALLDSTMTFFFILAMFWLVKWMKTVESKWIYLLASTTGLAILTKVTAILIISIAIFIILVTRQFRNLTLRTVVRTAIVFTVSVSPAILQFLSAPSLITSFLMQSSTRYSNVPITYYLDKLASLASPFFIGLSIFGVIVALVKRKSPDLLCLIWTASVIVFFQAYPLKGFNYILPLVPVTSLLAGRGITSLMTSLNRKHIFVIGMIGLLTLASYTLSYASLYNVVYDRSFVGLREAAYWLRDNTLSREGAMTISQGSAQYVLSFYGKIDAYPFGDFQLHTVLPGGGFFQGAPPPDPLIQNGTVTYLVHYVSWGGDDPIHMMNKTQTETRFIELVQKYQGECLNIIYYNFTDLKGVEHQEARVWIFKVGKRLPNPEVNVSYKNASLQVSGAGFLIDSYVNVYYGSSHLEQIITDDMGSFTVSIGLQQLIPGAKLVFLDPGGNRFSTSF
jgi:hypothetical protein